MSCNIIDYKPKNLTYLKEQGDHFQVSLTITDSDDVAIDLSDATDIQFFVDDTEVASLGSGITVSGAGSNVVNIVAADTRAVGNNYTYSVVVTDVDGVIRTYIEGKLKIS